MCQRLESLSLTEVLIGSELVVGGISVTPLEQYKVPVNVMQKWLIF